MTDPSLNDRVDDVHSDTIDKHRYRGNFSEIVYRGVHNREWPGKLFISDIHAAENYMLLRALDVDVVVNVTDSEEPEHAERLNGYHQLRVDDTLEADEALLGLMLDDADGTVLEKIRDGLYLGNVLVHCRAGVSRSATVVVCYLMQHAGMSPGEALDTVRRSRPCAFHGSDGKLFFNFAKTLKYFKNANTENR